MVLAVAAIAALAMSAPPASGAQSFACQDRDFVLDSLANARAVSAEQHYAGALAGMMRARATAHDSWERFRMVCLDGGEFAIVSLASGRYVSAEHGYGGDDNGMLRARATVIAPWERFTFEQSSQTGDFRRGALRSAANGRYVSAELGYATDDVRYGMLRARATVKAEWEQFELTWLPLPAPPGPVDADGDGFSVGQDCNDADPGVRPGGFEVRGNRVDENCDGRDEDLPAINSGVSSEFRVDGKRFAIRKLRARNVLSTARVELQCAGRRCPITRVRVARRQGNHANLARALGDRARRGFRAGQTLEVRITAPGYIGKVVRYRLRRGRIPDGRPLCLRPGAPRPHRCA